VRIQILADLHRELNPAFDPPLVDADVVVLAGDVARGSDGVEWMRAKWASTPVIYVAGNHEFCNRWQNDFFTMPDALAELRAKAAGTNVHFLENDEVVIGDVRFLGCTLWTDFALFGQDVQDAVMTRVEKHMPEYAHAFINPEQRLRARDVLELHQASRRWLKERLYDYFEGSTIVVTHHAPSARSSSVWHVGDPLNPAFFSNLESLCDGERVRLWIHGHTHNSVDYEIKGTRIISNQRGYRHDGNDDFRGDLVVEA
jgi:predicted phosphodiesterase